MQSQLTGINIMIYTYAIIFSFVVELSIHPLQLLHNLYFRRSYIAIRDNFIVDSFQFAIYVVFTLPAIVYIHKQGHRPMLIIGTLDGLLDVLLGLCKVGRRVLLPIHVQLCIAMGPVSSADSYLLFSHSSTFDLTYYPRKSAAELSLLQGKLLLYRSLSLASASL